MDEFRKIVGRLAKGYLPRIAEFLRTEWSDNASALAQWEEVVASVGRDLDTLSGYDNILSGFGHWGRTGAIFRFMAESGLKDKSVRKGFLEGKHEPATREGNPQMLSDIALSIDFALDRTYAIITGKPAHEDSTVMGRALKPLGSALEKGEIRGLAQVQRLLLEPLSLLEKELARTL